MRVVFLPVLGALDAFETGSEDNSGAISTSWNANEIDGIAALEKSLKDFPEASSVLQYASTFALGVFVGRSSIMYPEIGASNYSTPGRPIYLITMTSTAPLSLVHCRYCHR